MKTLRLETIKIRTMIGFGYWKDIYTADDHGVNGVAYNGLLLFWHYQVAYLNKPEEVEEKKAYGFQGRLEAAIEEQKRFKDKITNRK